MDLKVASCNKCGEFEPYDWDYEQNGLWTCNCKPKNKKTVEETLQEMEE